MLDDSAPANYISHTYRMNESQNSFVAVAVE